MFFVARRTPFTTIKFILAVHNTITRFYNTTVQTQQLIHRWHLQGFLQSTVFTPQSEKAKKNPTERKRQRQKTIKFKFGTKISKEKNKRKLLCSGVSTRADI
jgi:hypothetical protein